MAHVVGRTEDKVEGEAFGFHPIIATLLQYCGCTGLQGCVGIRQQDGTFGIDRVAYLTVSNGNIGFAYELILVGLAQHVPIPVGDGVVEMVSDIVDDHLVPKAEYLFGSFRLHGIVGIEVGLDAHEGHLSV